MRRLIPEGLGSFLLPASLFPVDAVIAADKTLSSSLLVVAHSSRATAALSSSNLL